MFTNDEVTVLMLKAQAFWNKWKNVDFSKPYDADALSRDEKQIVMMTFQEGVGFDDRFKVVSFFLCEIIDREARAGGRK